MQTAAHDSPPQEFETFERVGFVLEVILLVPIALIGVLCNVMAVPILLSKKLFSLFNQTLAVLAIFDTIYVLCELLDSARQYNSQPWTVHLQLFPVLLYPLQVYDQLWEFWQAKKLKTCTW